MDNQAEGGFSSAAEQVKKTHGVTPEDQKKLTALGVSYQEKDKSDAIIAGKVGAAQ